MDTAPLNDRSGPFLRWVARWVADLVRRPFTDIIPEPAKAAVMSVDLIRGFCYEGPLSSPRVAGIVPRVVALFETAYASGVRLYILFQDTHDEDALEFDAFGPHCIAGTRESEMIPELSALPFSDRFRVVGRNTISSAIGTELDNWLASNTSIDRFIVVGDCTDLCVYQLAMHLKLTANAAGVRRTVIVPADCVDTYDMPLDRADELGVLPHDGGLLHDLFLYHMALNGVEVIAGME